jgi:membrane-bound serine protease (ClpP class)
MQIKMAVTGLALLTVLFFSNTFHAADAGTDPQNAIWVINIEGAIGPATSDYVIRGLEEAQMADAPVIILKMSTPGGLDTAMRDIIKAILASEVPVVSYVSPKGSRAASAGTYISYASHIAAMAPATNLGAATPVQIASPSLPSSPGEEDAEPVATTPSAMEKKMVNDASAYIRGLAELRNRNAEWAELAVREAASMDAVEALEAGVIDIIAEDIDDLLDQIQGWVVSVDGDDAVIEIADRRIHHHEPDWRTEILSVITNPSMILVLGMIGFYGVILEFYNPGSLIPGVIGVICLLLAAYSVQLLPLNYAGLALLVLGLGLMVAEAMVPSFGILGIGGVIAFSIGALMLFDTEMEAFQVGLPTIFATAVVSASLIFATVSIAMRIRRQAVSTGDAALIGSIGHAMADFEDEGQVKVGAEIWRAASDSPIAAGEKVSVSEVDGLLLTVTKIEGEKS